MKSLIQRVSEAKVVVDGEITGAIGPGILILLGLEKGDESETQAKLDYHISKLTKLRIFPDEAGKMNRSIQDIGGQFLVVSQFTLAGDCRKGTRPSFDSALPPNLAEPLYEQYVAQLRQVSGCPVETGIFGAMMEVHLINDGPVTFMLEC